MRDSSQAANAGVRVAMFPDSDGNPYIGRLRSALASDGVGFVSDHANLLSVSWLRRHAGEGLVLHLHWPSQFYASDRVPTVTSTAKFVAKWLWARRHGYHLSWTCHNLLPHEADPGRWLHLLVRRVLCGTVDWIFVHSRWTVSELDRLYGAGRKCVVMPHGDLIGELGPAVSRQAARGTLGLEDDVRVFCAVGKIRAYKGVEALISSFRRVASPSDRLLIAGLAEPEMAERLRAMVAGQDSIRLDLGWVPDDRLLAYLGAADAMVFPFTRILNSSSLILAMSYSSLCVAPRTGSLPEVLPEDAGVYYEPEDANGLIEALRGVQRLAPDEAQERRRRALEAAKRLSWSEAARVMAGAWAGSRRDPAVAPPP